MYNEEYEQLKVANRRRLLGAIIVVSFSAILLISALNRHNDADKAQPNVEIATVEQQNIDNSFVNPPEEEFIASEAFSEISSVENPTKETIKLENNINQTEEIPNIQPETTTSTEVTAPPANIKQSETKTTEVKEIKEAKKVEKPKEVATNKTKVDNTQNKKTETKKVAEQNKQDNKATAKKTNKEENKTASNKNTKNTEKKLTPQEILNGKAGNTVNDPTHLVIQAGAFMNRGQAETQRAKLAQQGIVSQIHSAKTSKGDVYRVRIGPFSSKQEAQKTLDNIHSKGFDGILVTK